MKKQLSIFDGTDETKEALAISLIKSFEGVSLARNPLGYVVGYSGGKDSEVLVDLFIKSGIKFIVIHNHTGLDAPETVYFIRKKFKQWREKGIDCRIYYPKKSFWALCNEKKMLPTRRQRFCCAELKERNDIPELKFATHSFGVRKTESSKRANNRDSIETRNTESFGKTCGCNRPNGTCGNYDRFLETYSRLTELEDKIENGTLVPKYLIVESCGTYCVCSVDTENLPIIDTYETEKEAQKKLEKLYEEM